jgi:hypothetical protein
VLHSLDKGKSPQTNRLERVPPNPPHWHSDTDKKHSSTTLKPLSADKTVTVVELFEQGGIFSKVIKISLVAIILSDKPVVLNASALFWP